MIGTVHDRVVEHILTPQATVDEVLNRALYEPDAAPLTVALASLQLLDMSSTPINPSIRSGFGLDGAVMFRHILSAVVVVEDATIDAARERRDAIVMDLVRRAYAQDWTSWDIGADRAITTAGLTIEYPELETEQLQLFATVTFTVDEEWTL